MPSPENTNGFGYSFGGWYDDPNFNSYIGQPGDLYVPNNSQQEIYPRWNPSWITIEYIFEDSEFYCYLAGYWQDPTYPVPENIYNAQEIAANCDSNLSKPGYRLIAWNTAADGSGVTYNFGDSVNVENLALYPIWEELSSNLIAPDTALVDPRVNFVNFPAISLNGSANILICVQESDSGGTILGSPTVNFDVASKGATDTTGFGSATVSGDRTSTLLIRHTRENVLDTFNSLGGLRAYLSSGNFTSTKYVRVRTLPVVTSTTEVTSATCADAAAAASKTIEIRPLGLTNTLRKGTIQLK